MYPIVVCRKGLVHETEQDRLEECGFFVLEVNDVDAVRLLAPPSPPPEADEVDIDLSDLGSGIAWAGFFIAAAIVLASGVIKL